MDPQNPTAYATSSNLLGGASDIYEGMATDGSLTNINKYINPYYDNVLNAALGRMDTTHQQNLDQIGDSAQMAGAYGGSRHGVAEGVAMGEHQANVGETASNLLYAGYTDAATRATTDQMNAAQGMTQLGNNMYQIGNDVTDRQMMQGTTQQQMLQTILGQGSSMFDQYMSDPYKMIDLFSSVLSGDARRQNVSTTQTSTPGLFDYLSLGAQAYAG